ncbi:MAG TPA: endolytic transglycosylase MltG [Gemmatimonadaceae bacterium]|nr:endolytic transglycosylase MltG [Gemmatimonadaceae bacterium]
MRRSRLARRIVLCGAACALAACSTGDSTTVRVSVPTGASVRIAADSLAKAGVVRSARLFRAFAYLSGGDRRIRPGTYEMGRGESWFAVLDALRRGRGIVSTVTIPEGFALEQIEPLLAGKLGVPLDSVRAAATDTALLARLDLPTPTLEGYLFPDTYTFPEGTTAREAVGAMVAQFERTWKPAWTARLDTIDMSRNDLMTLASIVEKEAKLPEERPVIAAVYMNRLRAGMLLQADPTVQYALPQHETRLLYKDLKVKSPYNTYRHLGLPPGPIASPGKASILAALYPAHVPYKYFVAAPDGHHEFRVDYKGHEAAVREMRRERAALARADAARKDTTRARPPVRKRD